MQKHWLELVAILQRADETEAGIELEFESNQAMRSFQTRLASVRLEFPDYKHISFHPRGEKLWLIKGKPDETKRPQHNEAHPPSKEG